MAVAKIPMDSTITAEIAREILNTSKRTAGIDTSMIKPK